MEITLHLDAATQHLPSLVLTHQHAWEMDSGNQTPGRQNAKVSDIIQVIINFHSMYVVHEFY